MSFSLRITREDLIQRYQINVHGHLVIKTPNYQENKIKTLLNAAQIYNDSKKKLPAADEIFCNKFDKVPCDATDEEKQSPEYQRLLGLTQIWEANFKIINDLFKEGYLLEII